MITKEQFRLQIERLADTFGDKAFPDQRVHMMWESAQEHLYPTVISIVDQFIRNSKSAPLPGDFAEALSASRSQKRKYALSEMRPKEICQCFDCADSGFIRLVRNEQFEEWAEWASGSAPCHCHRGRMAIEAAARKPKGPIDLGPQFSDHWLSSYTVVPEYEGNKEQYSGGE